MRYGTPFSSIRYPPKASSTSHLVFLSTIPRWFPNASCPVFFCTALIQDFKLWIVSIWQCFPSGRSATVGVKQKSIRGMPRESDISSFSMVPSPCKSLAQGRIHGTHPTTSPFIQETKKLVGEVIINKSWRKDNIETMILAVIIKISPAHPTIWCY